MQRQVLAAVFAIFGCAAPAATLEQSYKAAPGIQDGFLGRHAEGWFWYKDPEPEASSELTEIPPPKEAKTAPTDTSVMTTGSMQKNPEPLTAAWVRVNLDRYREIAWDNPSEENVKAYFLLQRFAIDRSEQFADVAERVTVGNALLDESMRRPFATFANRVVDQVSQQRTDALLRRVSEHAGIFFFFKQGCRFCEIQAPLIKHIEQIGLKVIAVSVDGGQLANTKFDDTRIDSGQAAKLGVRATPTIFLMNEKGEFDTLTVGALSLPELKRRILLSAARSGILTPEELDDTKAILTPQLQPDLSRELPELLKASVENPAKLWSNPTEVAGLGDLVGKDLSGYVDETGFISPKKLLELVGDKAQTRRTLSDAKPQNAGEDRRLSPQLIQ